MNSQNIKNRYIKLMWVVKKKPNTAGNNRTNSTSNTRKTRAIKKNWSDKVCRLFSHGENPHSNGESLVIEAKTGQETIIKTATSTPANIRDRNIHLLRKII